MSDAKIHWHPPSARLPRVRCGEYLGTAVISRDIRKVTCLRCRGDYLRAQFGLEGMRGRPIEIRLDDGEITRGELIDSVSRGLQVCRPGDDAPVLLTWRRIRKAEFVARAGDADGEPEDAPGNG